MKTPIIKRFDSSWYEGFGKVMLEQVIMPIAKHVKVERLAGTVHPPAGSELMFKAFQMTPLEKVKIVIVGLDPYHGGAFNGLAFGNGTSDNPATTISPSLRKVIKGVEANFSGKVDPSLYSWAEQGVLLINTAHTVREKDAGSHLSIWEPFTQMIFKAINTKPNVVWLLWGAKAQAFESSIMNDTHHVILSGHPSPLNRTNPFDGQCFVECNKTLKDMGLTPIQWTDRI